MDAGFICCDTSECKWPKCFYLAHFDFGRAEYGGFFFFKLNCFKDDLLLARRIFISFHSGEFE